MRRSRRIAWWSAYVAGSAAVLAGLAWTTTRVLRLEREEALARAENDRQAILRLALWRLDSWMAPRLARESGRAWYEYEPYHPQTIAFNRLLEPIADGEVLVPSPLLAFSSPWFPLHFQWRRETGFTSPQVLPASMDNVEMVACGPVIADPVHAERLEEWTARVDGAALEGQLAQFDLQGGSGDANTAVTAAIAPLPPQQQAKQWSAAQQVDADAADFKARAANTNYAQQLYVEEVQAAESFNQKQVANQLESKMARAGKSKAPIDRGVDGNEPPDVLERPPTPSMGAMAPLWIDGDRLVIARRVEVGDRVLVQGAFVDWPALRTALLAQVADVLPGAAIEPDRDGGDGASGSLRLASLPARLLAPTLPEVGPTTHPAIPGLVLVWLAAFGAIGATGLALRASIGAAVRTSRFASSVTHELRTPLTTFRLYSEMLADGVVRDPERMAEYFATLRDESARLGLLVENVLAWSRAEDGRAPRELRAVTLGSLVEAVAPMLARRCAESDAKFTIAMSAPGDLRLVTDPDRVRQILFNLVDNACKYAGESADVRLSADHTDGQLVLAIDDSGPGVPNRVKKRVFRAFDRGDRGPGDAVRGLGLGLAISMELARGLGGRLRCERSTLGGARFALNLPVGAASKDGAVGSDAAR